jgi:molybdenum cofactor cytidylyltransferase
MYDGIILAGGYSSRLKKNKMTLKINDQEIILHTIRHMHKICEKIIVVTGHYHEELVELLKDISYIEIVKNKNYELGMFSSVLIGVKQVKNSFFITPGDYPLISSRTYEVIANGKKKIRVPSYDKHLGHPIFIDISLKTELLNGGFKNLKAFRDAHDFEYIDVNDSNILLDIDTLEDLQTLKERIDSVGS